MEYSEFLAQKRDVIAHTGFSVKESELNNLMFPFQKWIVKRALKQGKFAVFADCGLGKTLMYLEWANLVSRQTKKPVLCLTPLAVTAQTILEGVKFGIECSELLDKRPSIGVWITNYEQLHNIDCSVFSGVVLDESSILKNYSGATKQLILESFANTEFKLALTATPSPNDELEIGNHAEFLNIMTSQDMRSIYFTTDKEIIKGNKYRLKNHSKDIFYSWIASWAVMLSKPSDIGFQDTGYDLPGLNFIEKELKTEIRESIELFNSNSVSATTFNSELRFTKVLRMEEVAAIVNNSNEPFIIWIKHNEEGEILRKLIPDSIEVSGSDSNEYKKKHLIGFQNNEFRVLITKTKIASFGLNYQNCNNQIFASLDFSFESLYQAIRRSYRFGQTKVVNIYLITLDTMQNVINSINEKQDKFIEMQNQMKKVTIENNEFNTVENISTDQVKTDFFECKRGDSLQMIKDIPDNSIGYSFFSPPFGALYVFSNDPADLSNVKNNDEFMTHFEFLVPELYRVLKQGRLVSIHIMQGTTLLGRDGFYSIIDLRGDIIRLFQKHGFYFHEEHMIRKDPKTAAIRTKNRQLMHGTTKKDSTIVRPGLADYIISFKKPGENKEPVRNNIPFDLWCEMAEPVWMSMNEGDTLEYRSAKENDDERHLTPTQLKPIEWCTLLYSNTNDICYCPFGGIGSEGFKWLQMDRKVIIHELKQSYYNVMVRNCKNAVLLKAQATLFDL
jgi:DNA modification methylase/superfamily II DNA or RNA helicase